MTLYEIIVLKGHYTKNLTTLQPYSKCEPERVVITDTSRKFIWEQFLRSKDQEEENQTVKTKKAPLGEGPNSPTLIQCNGKVSLWSSPVFSTQTSYFLGKQIYSLVHSKSCLA